jgi:hypothetical protein
MLFVHDYLPRSSKKKGKKNKQTNKRIKKVCRPLLSILEKSVSAISVKKEKEGKKVLSPAKKKHS